MSDLTEEQLKKIYNTTSEAIFTYSKKCDEKYFASEQHKAIYKELLEKKITDVLTEYPEVMLYNNYNLGHLSCVYGLDNVAIFISKYVPSALYQFDNCGTSMYERASEDLQEKLKEPREFYKEFVKRLFSNELEQAEKKQDTKVKRNIDDDIYYAIFYFTQKYFTTSRLENKYFKEAAENKFIDCMRKYPQITKLQHFKGITLGISFANYGLDRCTEFIIKHREGHSNITDKHGYTMFDYMRPELLNNIVTMNPRVAYKTMIDKEFSALKDL